MEYVVKNRQIIVLFIILFFSQTDILAILQTNNSTTDTQQNNSSNNDFNSILENKSKLIYTIPESHSRLINKIFKDNLIYMLRLQSSYKNSKIILTKKDNIKEAEVEKFKQEMLKPVKDIFPLLHKKIFRFINEPLFISLLSQNLIDKIKNTAANKNIIIENIKLEDASKYLDKEEMPACLIFLNTDAREIDGFFEKYIHDKDSLLKVCEELIQLFGSLNKTFTEETKNGAKEFYKKLIEQSNKQKNNHKINIS